jgi:hypothetical protein
MHSFPGNSSVVGGFQYPAAGANSVAEYLSSGLPFVTASIQSATPFKIDFPFVTSEIYINVSGTNAVRLGFTADGILGNNYFVVQGGDNSTPLRIRCKSIYIMAHAGASVGYSVMAAMTTIPGKNFPVLTGSVANPDTGGCKFISSSYENVFGYRGLSAFPPA